MGKGWDTDRLKEHGDAMRAADRRTIGVAMLGMVGAAVAVIWGMQKATRIALDAANEKGVHHNGLIDRMREMQASYVTKGSVILMISLALAIATLAWSIFGRG